MTYPGRHHPADCSNDQNDDRERKRSRKERDDIRGRAEKERFKPMCIASVIDRLTGSSGFAFNAAIIPVKVAKENSDGDSDVQAVKLPNQKMSIQERGRLTFGEYRSRAC